MQHVTDNGTVYAREVDSGGKRLRTVALPAEYVSEHAHWSYAATAYGVQDATVYRSLTMLSDATSVAGVYVYVGMTRGRQQNQLHVVAENMDDARAQFVEAMERDPADRGLDHATAQAIDAVRGLVVDGPVQLVTDEIARLATEVERAEQLAERWEQTATRFDAQRATHKAKDDEHADVLRRAEADLRVIDVAQQVEAARGDRDAMRERREQEQRQQALAEREWQLSEPTEADRRHDPQHDGPARGL